MNAISEAVQALAEIRQKKFQPIPDGWFSLEQFAKHLDCCVAKARYDMAALVKAGKFITRRWPKLDSRGRTCYSTIYRKKQNND